MCTKIYLVVLVFFLFFLVIKAAGEKKIPEHYPHHRKANTVNILAFFFVVIFPFSCRRVRLCCTHSLYPAVLFLFKFCHISTLPSIIERLRECTFQTVASNGYYQPFSPYIVYLFPIDFEAVSIFVCVISNASLNVFVYEPFYPGRLETAVRQVITFLGSLLFEESGASLTPVSSVISLDF